LLLVTQTCTVYEENSSFTFIENLLPIKDMSALINLVQIITRDSFHLKLARALSPNWMKGQVSAKNVWQSHWAYAYVSHCDTMGMQTNWMRDIGSYLGKAYFAQNRYLNNSS
jgi:hypothetical protein